MRNSWHRITHLGIDDSIPHGEVRFIVLANVLAFITGSAQVATVSGFLLDWPFTKIAVYYALASAPAYWLVLLINHWSHHHAARIYFNLLGLFQILGLLVIFGVQSGVHLFFLLIPITAFFTYPLRHRKSMVLIILLGGLWSIVVPTVLRDSPPIMATTPQLAAFLRTNFLVSIVVFFLGFTYYIWSILGRAEKHADVQRQRSEDLLHSILPEKIAIRLKEKGDSISDGFADASILFADIVGFTELAGRKSPAQLVSMLNDVFSRFDDRLDDYSLEKIKTIGDAYMVAAGIPEPLDDHATAICRFAIEMVRTLNEYNQESGEDLQIRIGINSGPVVAGVIGKKKFIYDLWGDSVNTAARMESHGVAGAIQVTRRTHDLVDGRFEFEDRGEIEVKGKGMMQVYLMRP